MSLLDPSVIPQDAPQGDPEGATESSTIVALTTLGLRLVQACKHAHMEQGVGVTDLLWMLHGVMGQVLAWGFNSRR